MSLGLPVYPAYRDSGVPWLGEIPAHWELVPGFGAFREVKRPNTSMRETTVLSLSYGRIVVKPSDRLHGLVPASFETYQVVEPENIIIRPTDLQNDWNSLRVGIARDPGIITSAYLCLEARGKLTPDYLFNVLHAYDLMKIFYGMGSGLRQNLDFADLKRMPVLAPPCEEQDAIARYIAHLDGKVNRFVRARRRMIALLNEQKQAIIQQAVTRGLDPSVPVKPSGVEWLGDIPEHWEVWQVGHFARVGNGSTPSRGKPTYWTEQGYPWLNSSSVHQEQISHSTQFVTELALRECHLPKVSPGSVLVAITGQGKTRGTAGLLYIEATINQHIAYMTPKSSRVLPDYLLIAFKGAYRQLRAMSDDSGSTKGALTCEDLKHFPVALPPTNEQATLVKRVKQDTSGLNRAIAVAERQISLILEYRTRLVADVVTGKVDVRVAAAALPVLSGEDEAAALLGDEETGEDGDDLPTLGSEEENGADD